MTRLWQNRQPITVEVNEAGLPVGFKWNGAVYAIVKVANKWRADRGWWDRRIWREHFKIATKNGMLAVIYHDLQTDQWYLQQIYD